ncbi:hypothetical protein PPERSA_04791 [Pseudocohnilembus persalinus]|uniref:SAYSvFN domain-containing protein n=1 Tax=Pseudocohnilembus persalinus TaxID=266149 RepID=A0A0V0Q9M4_PSEPJ|nr:hypothetical protein PPERSA_04791 [Pseudocohnilembus persalinus]|eukprot:KRW98858.1 hypothetical protein PPERSA_04791 [Pseudocohnilembus persalinus]
MEIITNTFQENLIINYYQNGVKNLTNQQVTQGGAIYYQNQNKQDQINIKSNIFDKNKAQSGGAVFINSFNKENNEQLQIFILINNFTNNIAVFGSSLRVIGGYSDLSKIVIDSTKNQVIDNNSFYKAFIYDNEDENKFNIVFGLQNNEQLFFSDQYVNYILCAVGQYYIHQLEHKVQECQLVNNSFISDGGYEYIKSQKGVNQVIEHIDDYRHSFIECENNKEQCQANDKCETVKDFVCDKNKNQDFKNIQISRITNRVRKKQNRYQNFYSDLNSTGREGLLQQLQENNFSHNFDTANQTEKFFLNKLNQNRLLSKNNESLDINLNPQKSLSQSSIEIDLQQHQICDEYQQNIHNKIDQQSNQQKYIQDQNESTIQLQNESSNKVYMFNKKEINFTQKEQSNLDRQKQRSIQNLLNDNNYQQNLKQLKNIQQRNSKFNNPLFNDKTEQKNIKNQNQILKKNEFNQGLEQPRKNQKFNQNKKIDLSQEEEQNVLAEELNFNSNNNNQNNGDTLNSIYNLDLTQKNQAFKQKYQQDKISEQEEDIFEDSEQKNKLKIKEQENNSYNYNKILNQLEQNEAQQVALFQTQATNFDKKPNPKIIEIKQKKYSNQVENSYTQTSSDLTQFIEQQQNNNNFSNSNISNDEVQQQYLNYLYNMQLQQQQNQFYNGIHYNNVNGNSLYYLAIKMEFGLLFLSISGIIFIFTNLGARAPGTLSAYSVFNKNFEKIAGTLDHTQIDQQFGSSNQQQQQTLIQQKPDEMCKCGSGNIYRKCCYWKQFSQKSGITIGESNKNK